MAFLVKQTVARPCTCVEHAYEERVNVVQGYALVQHRSTVTYLHTCGYDLVTELPPLEELETDPALCAELARLDLGPWAGKTAEELAALVGAGQ